MSRRIPRILALITVIGALLACSPSTKTDSGSSWPTQKRAGNEAQTLFVAAEYSKDTFRLHYRLEVANPSWYHQYWRYQDGTWTRMGDGSAGPDIHGLYEDRISMMLDDGSVEGFRRYGGWMLVHPGMRSLDSAVESAAVRAHPLLGEIMGRSDVRKYIPQSRSIESYTEPAPWDAVRSLEELAEMQDRGEFLDLWQWRAHRSNPVGFADNGYVLHYRLNSEGRGMYRDNRAEEAAQPAFMFNPALTGKRAMSWERLVSRGYDQDDYYFLSEDLAIPFDTEHAWQDGDVIPFRLLQTPSGPRGAIAAAGRYHDGAWRVTLERSMTSPNPRDSKELRAGEIYHVAFAVHHGAVGARHHRVSLPHSLGIGTDADIVAVYADSPLAEEDLVWHAVTLINPGQVDWEWLLTRHPGAGLIRGDFEISVQDHHGFLPLLQRYIDRRRP